MDDTAKFMLPQEPMLEETSGCPSRTRPVRVWDLPTRVFHWAVVAAVLAGWLSAESGGLGFVVHQAAGYVILVGLLFRVVWGVSGSRHSRFADFVRPWPVVRAHLAGLARLRPARTVGHSPSGGWMIVALLACLAVLVLTGLFAGGDNGAGPFAYFAGPAVAPAIAAAHGFAFDALVALAIVHVCGVAVEAWLTGGPLFTAMWSGRKPLTAAEAVGEGRMVATRWAVATAAVAAVLVVCVVL